MTTEQCEGHTAQSDLLESEFIQILNVVEKKQYPKVRSVSTITDSDNRAQT